MNGIQNSLFTAAFTLCMFSAGILSEKRSRSGHSFAYFTYYLLLGALRFLLELLMAHPSTPLKSLWLGLLMATSLLLAPCLWLAVQESVDGVRPKLSSIGRRERWAVQIGMLLTLPLLETAHLGLSFKNPERVVSALHSRLIHAGMLLCVLVFAAQVPFYLLRCRRALLQQLESDRARGEDAQSDSSRWVHIPLLVVFTTWIVGILRTLHCALFPAQQALALLFVSIEVSVTVGAIYLMVRRAADPGLRAAPLAIAQRATELLPAAELRKVAPQTTQLEVQPPSAEAPHSEESKYAKSSLDSETVQRIARKLESVMLVDELYRESLLSLRSLSERIRENPHYVSQVLNQQLKSNFYDFVNRYRVQKAKALLISQPELSVLEIAVSVGFNSKSTFNTAFRRNTGTTPSQYRATHSTIDR